MSHYLLGLAILTASLLYLFSQITCTGFLQEKKDEDLPVLNKYVIYSILGFGGAMCFCGFIIVFVAGQIHRF